MAELGEIKNGSVLGRKFTGRMIWHACIDCGKRRWVALVHGEPKRYRCVDCGHARCRGSGNPSWKGGKNRYQNGYVLVYLPRDNFFRTMIAKDKSYIAEHRLVMAKHLKRCLLPWEVVHHKNGVKDDNRLENLQLLPAACHHVSDTQLKIYAKKLERRIRELEDILDVYKYEAGE